MTRRGKLGNTPGADDHLTPPEVVDRVRMVAPIGFDPCGNRANIIAALTAFPETTQEDITLLWRACIPDWLAYVNPPFSDIWPWATKAAEEAREGVTVVMLVPCRTSQPYWGVLCDQAADGCGAIAFWDGNTDYVGTTDPAYLPRRIRFLRPDGTRQAGAPFDTAIFLLSQNPVHLTRFVRAFGDVATVIRPSRAPKLSEAA